MYGFFEIHFEYYTDQQKSFKKVFSFSNPTHSNSFHSPIMKNALINSRNSWKKSFGYGIETSLTEDGNWFGRTVSQKIDVAKLAGVRITNAKGARAIVQTDTVPPDLETVTFCRVYDNGSEDGCCCIRTYDS